MTKSKLKTKEAKIVSTLMKDINRIRKQAELQARMNILRKHQIRLMNKLIEKLIKERRISKEEVKRYMPRKRDAERKLCHRKNKKRRM